LQAEKNEKAFSWCQKVPLHRQIDVTLVRMAELEFILQDQHFPVERLVAHQVCDALAHRLHGNQLFVGSDVAGDVLRLFVSAIHGEAIELTNENIGGLSALCGERQFLSLSRRLEVFKNTLTYQLEPRFNTLKAKFQSMDEACNNMMAKSARFRRNYRGSCECKNHSSKEFEQKRSQRVTEQMKSKIFACR
jgi:hypothetical protein